MYTMYSVHAAIHVCMYITTSNKCIAMCVQGARTCASEHTFMYAMQHITRCNIVDRALTIHILYISRGKVNGMIAICFFSKRLQ
jgi:hypothetical protein